MRTRKKESKNCGKCHRNNTCCHGDSFMLSNRHKHKRRQTAASRSESVFPLHQAARRGGVVSPGGRTRANKRKTSRLCLASLSAFLPTRHFRKKECRFSSPARFLLIYYFCYWIKLIYVTTARAAVNHLTPKLLLATSFEYNN